MTNIGVSVPEEATKAIASIAELTSVCEGAPAATVYPYAQIQFAKGVYGDDDLLAVTIWDNEPTRAHHLGDQVELAVRTATFKPRLLRRRVVRDITGPWACAIDFRVRARVQGHSS